MNTKIKQPLWLQQGRDKVREMVRQRDGHRCQSCQKKWRGKGRRFDVHHLNGLCGKKSRSYDSVTTMDGLITYCHSCHMKKHATRNTATAKLPYHKEEVRQMRQSGMSYDAIGKKFGVSSQAVYFFLNGRN